MLAGSAGLHDPRISEAEVDWFNIVNREELLQRLPWLLNRDEKLLAVLWGSTGGPILHWDKSGFLAFTNRRVILLDKDAFLREGSVRRSLYLTDLGPLTVSDRPGGQGGHDLVTTLDGSTTYLQGWRGTTAADMGRLAALISDGRDGAQTQLNC